MRRDGFTLLEVVLAIGLLSILVLALIQLVDSSTRIWARAERSRDLSETGSVVLDVVARDLATLEGGARGDLVCDWAAFDTDRDGIRDRFLPRLRVVRQASAEDLLRLEPGQPVDPRALGLIEVCWALLPTAATEPEARSTAVLLRGERPTLGPADRRVSFLSSEFFDTAGRPQPGTLEEVTSGVLWFAASFAGPMTILNDGWKVGSEIGEASMSWDATCQGRLDPTITVLNEELGGAPRETGSRPFLPRRIRIELELEREVDRKRRPRLDRALEPDTNVVVASTDRNLPAAGTFLLVDEEWMELVSVDGARLTVRRGARATRPTAHGLGAVVHFGKTLVREVPIALARDDWGLDG